MSEHTIDSATNRKPALDAAPKQARKAAKNVRAAKKAPLAKKAGKPNADRTNKKAEVIAMMKRAKGGTLAEIMKATGWQAHTVRGFVSLLGGKGGATVESSKSAAGERSTGSPPRRFRQLVVQRSISTKARINTYRQPRTSVPSRGNNTGTSKRLLPAVLRVCGTRSPRPPRISKPPLRPTIATWTPLPIKTTARPKVSPAGKLV